jgi:hypothetical protein
MSLSHAFRLSFYLSLAMSCVCLFYGEWDFIPWMTALLPFVLGLMVLAYRREGREYLGEQTANRLGTFIGIGTILWIGFKVPRSDQDIIAGGVPWPAALVPLLAPLLPILLLVKLFRPKKVTDFWVFQTIALVIVTLSCILAGEVFFFVLLTAYLMVQLWCLGLFFLYRNIVLAGDFQGHESLFGDSHLLDATPIPGRSVRTHRVVGFSVVVLFAGLGLFLLLPRFTDSPWVPAKLSAPGKVTIKTGIDATGGMDLSREGIVQLSKDTAFEFDVRAPVGAAADLPGNQHFRLQILDEYKRGGWDSSMSAPPYRQGAGRKVVPSEEHFINPEPFPETTPNGMEVNQVFLVFDVTPRHSGGLPLADPIDESRHVGMYPLVSDGDTTRLPFFKRNDDCDIYTVTSVVQRNWDKKLKYGQLLTPRYQDKEIPAIDWKKSYSDHLLAQEYPAVVEQWTRALLPKLPDLEEMDYAADGQPFPPSKHAKIARALSRHLAESGEFTYSLRLPALRGTMGPTAEFLLKVKVGHCERYAAGLALMLRTLAIPSRIVKGYSGCQQVEKGHYRVRQDQAHAWVEALVPGKEPGKMVWLQLDPTPNAQASADSMLPFFKWAWTKITNPEVTWKNLVMDYNTDRQAEVSDQFKQLWTSVAEAEESAWENAWRMIRWPALSLLGLMGVLIGYRIWRRRGWFASQGMALNVPESFYAQLLKVLDRQCQLRPGTGQTPLEFAHVARNALAHRAGAASLAELPQRAVLVLYRHRFGGEPPTAEVSQALEAEITQLEKALCDASPLAV